MNIFGDLFNLILLQPMINIMVGIIRALDSIGVSGSLGWAIIGLTTLITFITWPFRTAQIRNTKHTSEKMAELKPRLEVLKEKYKNDKMAFAQAQSALLKEHGVNPVAGCLPALIPIIIIFPLYQVILAFIDKEAGLSKINYFLYLEDWYLTSLPDPHFFITNLGSKPSEFATLGVGLLLIPILSGLLTLVQSKMMAPKGVKVYPGDSKKEKKEKGKEEDAMVQMQGQMLLMMPVMIGVFAFTLPVALSLYWVVLTILNIWQQYLIAGWGGFEEWLLKLGLKKA